MLSLDDVVVSYGRTPVIKGVSFSVGRGETFGFIGLNGAGKTTLIKAILGLREHGAGRIEIGGQPHTHAESKEMLAYLPEKFEPPWFLKGREFVHFSCSFSRQAISDEDIDHLANRLGLALPALERRVQTYSKGMRQKLGLLATLMTGCPFLILDEPMSGLDPKARVAVKNVILEAGQAGRTIFLSSHILADMDEICTRVGVLHGGQLVYEGTPGGLRDIYDESSLEKAFLKVIEDH
ncbi:MAG: ABC transporter ATP-binding protein [Rhodospirillales bacterium]|nr:ABC transporter ATP-binding protein [Rhodospirillales bacterium]